MKHIKVFENFLSSDIQQEIPSAEVPMESPDVHFEVESDQIIASSENAQGSYFVNFTNSEGEKTTIEICTANDPEFLGDSMVSDIEMVPGSSSDGKQYTVVGYYDKVEGMRGAYELKKVLLEEN